MPAHGARKLTQVTDVPEKRNSALAPAALRGRYLALFSMSWGIGRTVAPGISSGLLSLGPVLPWLGMILAASGTAIQAYDQDAWSRAQHAEASDAQHSLALFTAIRESMVRLLRGLTDEELERYGMHSERGRESVRHLLALYAGHDRNHLAQIERLLT